MNRANDGDHPIGDWRALKRKRNEFDTPEHWGRASNRDGL
jgi:hypothetical protein